MKNTSASLTTKFDAKGEYVLCDLDDISLEADGVARGAPVATATPVATQEENPSSTDERKMPAVAPEAQKIDDDEDGDENEPTKMISWNSRSYASGVLCCMLSSCCVGPLFGSFLGCGAAYAAANSPKGTAVGDAARAMGDVALTAKAKAIEVDEKHAIVSRTKKAAAEAAVSTRQAAAGAWESIKDAEKRRKISKRSVAALRETGRRAQEWDREYRVTERTADGISRSFAYVAEKMREGRCSNNAETSIRGNAPDATAAMDDESCTSDASPLVQGGDGTFA